MKTNLSRSLWVLPVHIKKMCALDSCLWVVKLLKELCSRYALLASLASFLQKKKSLSRQKKNTNFQTFSGELECVSSQLSLLRNTRFMRIAPPTTTSNHEKLPSSQIEDAKPRERSIVWLISRGFQNFISFAVSAQRGNGTRQHWHSFGAALVQLHLPSRAASLCISASPSLWTINSRATRARRVAIANF